MTRTPTRNRQPALPAPSEKDVLKGALDLISCRGIFCWRNNTGMLRGANGQPVRFGRPGSPDILGVLPGGRLLAVEVKRPGNRPTAIQAAFLAELQRVGAAAFWVDDLAGLEVMLHCALRGWRFRTNYAGRSFAFEPESMP